MTTTRHTAQERPELLAQARCLALLARIVRESLSIDPPHRPRHQDRLGVERARGP